MAKSKGERVKIIVRMPSYLSRRLSALALAEGLSLNEYMVARLTAAADRESFNHILRTMGVIGEWIVKNPGKMFKSAECVQPDDAEL